MFIDSTLYRGRPAETRIPKDGESITLAFED